MLTQNRQQLLRNQNGEDQRQLAARPRSNPCHQNRPGANHRLRRRKQPWTRRTNLGWNRNRTGFSLFLGWWQSALVFCYAWRQTDFGTEWVGNEMSGIRPSQVVNNSLKNLLEATSRYVYKIHGGFKPTITGGSTSLQPGSGSCGRCGGRKCAGGGSCFWGSRLDV